MSGPEAVVIPGWLSVLITLYKLMITLVIFASVRGGKGEAGLRRHQVAIPFKRLV